MKKLISKRFLLLLFMLQSVQFSFAQTENINALTILIDFPDDPGFTPRENFTPMFNQATGYSGFGFNGSVRQYWSNVSNGKLNYTSVIVGWLRASQPRANYELYSGGGLDKLVAEVFQQIKDANFTGLTLRPGTNEIYSVNVIVEGRRTESLRGVAFGLANHVRIFNNGVAAYITGGGNTTTEDSEGLMSLATIAHEIGHQTFRWPEHYQRESRITNIGHYCLMGYGGWNRRVNPVPPNPGLRLKKGWIQNIVSLNVNQTTTFTVTSNDLNRTYKYTNPNNPREYYLVESYLKQGRFTEYTDEGLGIWYVDEEGGLKVPVKSDAYTVKLTQADGLDHLSSGSYGDANDLFDATSKNEFSDFTVPAARWKDGSLTGLSIKNISAKGTNMTFTVEKKSYTVNVTKGANGKITPSGTLMVNSGASQQFQITPDIGYQIDKILVNNVAVTNSQTYNLTNITGNRTVHVTFKKSTVSYNPPQPWQQNDFGTNVQGEVYFQNNTFHIKSFGWDIWNNTDNFIFESQPMNGNGEIIARIAEQDATSEWAKAGVMIRESLTDNSKHAFMAITPFQGPAFQHRTSTGGSSENSNVWAARSAIWVKLVRNGNTFSGYYSTNGISWTFHKSATISMGANVYIGLASSAATDLVKKKVIFDNITVKKTTALITKYKVPATTAIPTGFKQYQYIHTLGTGGPNLSHVFNSVFNWQGNTSNPNGLYQFTMEVIGNNPRAYTNIPDYGTYRLHTSSPEITINSTIGFNNMAGSYWVNLDGTNLVLVEKSGAYALYFSNSSVPPTIARESFDNFNPNVIADKEEQLFFVGPNPFTSNAEIKFNEYVDHIKIFDISGKLMETISPEDKNGNYTIGDSYPQGIYIIQLIKPNGTEIIKVVKE